MATSAAGFVIDLNDNEDGTTAVGVRLALAVLFKQIRPGVAASGRLGPDHFVVTGDPTSMKYHVSGGGLVITREATGGCYVIGVPDDMEVDTDPTDGVNPRIDIIWAKQPDPALDNSAGEVDFIVDVSVGVPAANPQPPAIPDGAFELARKPVPANAANTNAGLPFENIAPTTGLSFGGNVSIGQGGTGASSKTGARANLGFSHGTATPSNSFGENGDWYGRVI